MTINKNTISKFGQSIIVVWMSISIAQAADTQAIIHLWQTVAGELNMLDDPLSARPPILNQQSGEDLLRPKNCLNHLPEDTPLTLSMAIDLALCHHPQVNAAWANIKAQSASVGEAKASFLPTLTASRNRLTTQTEYPQTGYLDRKSGYTTSANLNWRLWDFNKRSHQLASTEQLQKSAIWSYDQSLRSIMMSVTQHYFEAIATQYRLSAKAQEVQWAQEIWQSTQRINKRGAVAGREVLQAQSHWAQAQLAHQEALGEVQKAQALLRQSLGIPARGAPGTLILPDSLAIKHSQDPTEIDDWIAWARRHHPSILAAEAQVIAAREKQVSMVAEGLPYLEATASFNENGYPGQGLQNNNKVTSYGINLVIPIFDGFANRYRVSGAQAQVEQKEAEWAKATADIELELTRLQADWWASSTNVDSAQTWVASAQAVVESAKRRMNKGVGAISEVLQAQQQASLAQQEYAKHLSRWHIARLQLWFFTGGGRTIDSPTETSSKFLSDQDSER